MRAVEIIRVSNTIYVDINIFVTVLKIKINGNNCISIDITKKVVDEVEVKKFLYDNINNAIKLFMSGIGVNDYDEAIEVLRKSVSGEHVYVFDVDDNANIHSCDDIDMKILDRHGVVFNGFLKGSDVVYEFARTLFYSVFWGIDRYIKQIVYRVSDIYTPNSPEYRRVSVTYGHRIKNAETFAERLKAYEKFFVSLFKKDDNITENILKVLIEVGVPVYEIYLPEKMLSKVYSKVFDIALKYYVM